MTLQNFREVLSRKPFVPFRVTMSSGEKYEVRHPEMAWLTRTCLMVGTGDFKDGVPEEFRICSLLHVATIESIETGFAA
jgi:hypothetical protein